MCIRDRAETFGADEVLMLPPRGRDRFDVVAGRVGGRVTRARLGNYMLSGGYDAVFECVGQRRTIEESLKWARSGGQVILLSTGHGRGADMTNVWFGELTVRGVSGRAEETFKGRRIHSYRLTHELMRSGAARVDDLLTHTFGLTEYKAALAAAIDKRAHRSVKVAFRYDGAEEPNP